MTTYQPGPAADLIDHAAGIIVKKMREPHTGPYHWAGALWEAGMLVAPGTGDHTINADLLYSTAELDHARQQYTADNPDGPPWQWASRHVTASYLEQASRWALEQIRAEMASEAASRRGVRARLAGWLLRAPR